MALGKETWRLVVDQKVAAVEMLNAKEGHHRAEKRNLKKEKREEGESRTIERKAEKD